MRTTLEHLTSSRASTKKKRAPISKVGTLQDPVWIIPLLVYSTRCSTTTRRSTSTSRCTTGSDSGTIIWSSWLSRRHPARFRKRTYGCPRGLHRARRRRRAGNSIVIIIVNFLTNIGVLAIASVEECSSESDQAKQSGANLHRDYLTAFHMLLCGKPDGSGFV